MVPYDGLEGGEIVGGGRTAHASAAGDALGRPPFEQRHVAAIAWFRAHATAAVVR